ncbi:MAG: hypothetical protein ACLQCU_07520 [Acidimicrobiales bacterium]
MEASVSDEDAACWASAASLGRFGICLQATPSRSWSRAALSRWRYDRRVHVDRAFEVATEVVGIRSALYYWQPQDMMGTR